MILTVWFLESLSYKAPKRFLESTLLVFTNKGTKAHGAINSFPGITKPFCGFGITRFRSLLLTRYSLHDFSPAFIWQISLASRISCESHIIYIYDALNNSEKYPQESLSCQDSCIYIFH